MTNVYYFNSKLMYVEAYDGLGVEFIQSGEFFNASKLVEKTSVNLDEWIANNKETFSELRQIIGDITKPLYFKESDGKLSYIRN